MASIAPVPEWLQKINDQIGEVTSGVKTTLGARNIGKIYITKRELIQMRNVILGVGHGIELSERDIDVTLGDLYKISHHSREATKNALNFCLMTNSLKMHSKAIVQSATRRWGPETAPARIISLAKKGKELCKSANMSI